MTDEEIKKIGTKKKFYEIFNSLQLTDRQKEIFLLKYGRGFMNEDIAAEIGFNRKVVSSELKTIREKMSQLNIQII